MTADNISTNGAIGRVLESSDDINFDHTTQVHGCVAHVINLAAKEGLKVFGEVLDDEDTEHPSNIHNLIDPPDVTQVNLKTIYKRCHGLVSCTRASPQRAQIFANIVTMRRQISEMIPSSNTSTNTSNTTHTTNPTRSSEQQREDTALQYLFDDPTVDHVKRPSTTTKLVVDVPTCWNSSYYMFRRLLCLQEACDEFCRAQEFKKLALTSLEWDYVKQMCNFLEPLSEATEILCKSKYPTMHQVVPIYVVVLQGLKKVSFFYILVQITVHSFI